MATDAAGPSADLILPVLLETLREPDSLALPLVIRLLDEIGTPVKAAEPALLDLLGSDRMRVPGAALAALQAIEASGDSPPILNAPSKQE